MVSKDMNLDELTHEVSVDRERGPRMSPRAPHIEKKRGTSKIGLEGAASEAGRKLRRTVS